MIFMCILSVYLTTWYSRKETNNNDSNNNRNQNIFFRFFVGLKNIFYFLSLYVKLLLMLRFIFSLLCCVFFLSTFITTIKSQKKTHTTIAKQTTTITSTQNWFKSSARVHQQKRNIKYESLNEWKKWNWSRKLSPRALKNNGDKNWQVNSRDFRKNNNKSKYEQLIINCVTIWTV